jgi:glycosyltransferase involved in cell wall biosynthesis
MSPQTHDYIFFADDRSSIPTSTMHLADQIAKTNRVFWVNIYTRLPKLSEFKKAFRILVQRGAKPAVNQQRGHQREGGSTIIAATPIQFPWFGLPGRKFNGYFAGQFFQKFVKQYDIQRPVLATNFPCVVDAFRTIRQLAPQAVQIYYCFDDFIEYPGFNPKHWAAMEQDFFATVDGVIFTSRDLLKNKKRQETLPSLYLPHGVDYDHFACEKIERTPIETLEKIKKPVVGFFGTIDTWVDISVIAYLAKRFPQCSFVVIGRSVVPLTILEGLENVHCLGQVPYSALPQYARYFDIGLIPFVLNDLTKAVNPLKLMEYYAIGIPVISTRLPDIADVPGPLYFADTHEEFGNRLDEILHSNLPELRRRAKEVARQNSWSARAESFVRFAEQSAKSQCTGLRGNDDLL